MKEKKLSPEYCKTGKYGRINAGFVIGWTWTT